MRWIFIWLISALLFLAACTETSTEPEARTAEAIADDATAEAISDDATAEAIANDATAEAISDDATAEAINDDATAEAISDDATAEAIADNATRFEIQKGEHRLTLDPPADWIATISDPELDAYGILTTRHLSEGIPSDIQIAFRDVEFLERSINSPLDKDQANPALAYLTQYADWQSQNMVAIYSPPIEVDAGGYPAAMMIYLETLTDNPYNSSHPSLLLISAAISLNEDQMLVILLEGSGLVGRNLYPQWIEALETLHLDGKPLPFAANFRDTLVLLDSPERLFSLYQARSGEAVNVARDNINREAFPLPGERQSVTAFGQSLSFSRYPNWELAFSSESEVRMAASDQAAQISVQLLPKSAFYTSASAYVESILRDTGLMLDPNKLEFTWGEYPSVWVTWTNPAGVFSRSSLLLLQMPNALGIIQLDINPATLTPQHLQDWENILLVMQSNGQPISVDDMIANISSAPPILEAE